ncbi:MAG: iron-containing redox enzyme family protein [Deltaproteobacteria bacterium]|nr:iron-containing redox enzyme family protein [Deltaproteobacteria bacterium]
MRGHLKAAAARELWEPEWPDILITNQFLLPRLLETCPDITTRAHLWRTMFCEYGTGHVDDSGPHQFRSFLSALDVGPSSCPMTLEDTPAIRAKIEKIESMEWPELLGRYLGLASIGPKVFDVLADALHQHLRIEEQHLIYFRSRARGGDRCAALLRIAESSAVADSDRRRVAESARRALENERSYCCNWSVAVHLDGVSSM